MAMPSEVEMYKHYRSIEAFRKDERELMRWAWRTSWSRTREVRNGRLRRIFGGQSHLEVDVRYVNTGGMGARWR